MVFNGSMTGFHPVGFGSNPNGRSKSLQGSLIGKTADFESVEWRFESFPCSQ
jgi:hypothetical protein